MPPKRRPAVIATLTGEREAKKHTFLTSLQKAERRCRQATLKISTDAEQAQSGAYFTRSRVSAKLYQLTVQECIECNQRCIEAFDEEYQALTKISALLCAHEKVIEKMTWLEDQIHPYPVIRIPALSLEGRAPPRRGPQRSRALGIEQKGFS